MADETSTVNEDAICRKMKSKCQLSYLEIASIIRSVQIDKLSHKETAIKHRVKVRLV